MRTDRIIVIAFSALMALSACHKRVPIAALPPAPSPATPSPAAAALDAADRAFSTGSFDEACRAYENYLRLNPSGEGRDQVLFRLGLSYVLRPSADWQRGMLSLRQVVETFPNSPFKAPASVILSLRSELDQLAANTQQRDQRIRQLAAELDRLKKIDAERRKRP